MVDPEDDRPGAAGTGRGTEVRGMKATTQIVECQSRGNANKSRCGDTRQIEAEYMRVVIRKCGIPAKKPDKHPCQIGTRCEPSEAR